MEPDDNDEKVLSEKLQERFNALPKALQNAITSAGIEKKLRGLSEVHKLHLDQWQKLENEVMLALLGFQPVENLVANIKKEVGMPDAEAEALGIDIADTIFQPIREELKRELGESTEEEKVSGEELVTSSQQPAADFFPGNPGSKNRVENEHMFDVQSPEPVAEKPVNSGQLTVDREVTKPVASSNLDPISRAPAPISPVPSTPPAPAPTQKSVRAILSPAYAPDTKSHERTAIDDDPYREPVK